MTTRVVRHDSNKASTSVNIISKLCSFSNYTEADFDQTINYSLLYAEENSVIEEVGHFEYLVGSTEQDNTVTTYYTEGTPFETPLHFSTSTSTSDLLKLDDSRAINTILEESEEFSSINESSENTEEKPEILEESGQLKSYMEFENKDKECENTDEDIYLPNDADDSDEKCDEERLEGVINVTPSQSPVELCEKDKDGKVVTFGGKDRYLQQTPLMFSRCSSLGSLSSYEQQSTHDDHSSVVSDFSRRTSEVVSPSELPDSPAQFVPSGQSREKKLGRKKIQLPRDRIHSLESLPSQQEILKRSIFEDDLAVFKEESTPIKFQSVTASSLSSLTIDDDEDIEEGDQAEMKNKTEIIDNLRTKTEDEFTNVNENVKRKTANSIETLEESSYFSVDEEQMLDEYIRKGIAKVTRKSFDEVSFPYDPSQSDPEKSGDSACKMGDDNSDLTAEEEKLLDECIRRGIAKVTGQNINQVSSLGLCSNFSGLPTISAFNKDEKQEKQQQQSEETRKRTAVCQTDQ